MSDVVIVGILSLVGTLAGAYLANRKSSALIAYRLEERGEDTSELRRELAFARADRCVCCGEIVPEGRQVCPSCERGTEK